jgi:hypothetical protein
LQNGDDKDAEEYVFKNFDEGNNFTLMKDNLIQLYKNVNVPKTGYLKYQIEIDDQEITNSYNELKNQYGNGFIPAAHKMKSANTLILTNK